jgi:hypothetical protein
MINGSTNNQFETSTVNDNAVVLANAGEVIAAVVNGIAGNDIASTLNNEKLTTNVIQSIAYQTIVANL